MYVCVCAFMYDDVRVCVFTCLFVLVLFLYDHVCVCAVYGSVYVCMFCMFIGMRMRLYALVCFVCFACAV